MDDKLNIEGAQKALPSVPWNAGRIIALVATVIVSTLIPALGLLAAAVGGWMNRRHTQVLVAFVLAGLVAVVCYVVTARPFGILG